MKQILGHGLCVLLFAANFKVYAHPQKDACRYYMEQQRAEIIDKSFGEALRAIGHYREGAGEVELIAEIVNGEIRLFLPRIVIWRANENGSFTEPTLKIRDKLKFLERMSLEPSFDSGLVDRTAPSSSRFRYLYTVIRDRNNRLIVRGEIEKIKSPVLERVAKFPLDYLDQTVRKIVEHTIESEKRSPQSQQTFGVNSSVRIFFRLKRTWFGKIRGESIVRNPLLYHDRRLRLLENNPDFVAAISRVVGGKLNHWASWHVINNEGNIGISSVRIE